tara:strand:- start:647 stop:1132 length:486 start_codon:yes stop_codon:yes gene_type:complete
MTDTRTIRVKSEPKSRVHPVQEITSDMELSCIQQLYLSGSCKERQKDIQSCLDKKITGYKGQDVKKNIHDPTTLITREEVLEKMVASKLKCYYCSKKVKILYSMSREPIQWSLDRIDNDMNHSCCNTVIACLDCNLKRRRRDADKFHFTKNLTISKMGAIN